MHTETSTERIPGRSWTVRIVGHGRSSASVTCSTAACPTGGGLSYAVGLDGRIYWPRTASLDKPHSDQVAGDLRQ